MQFWRKKNNNNNNFFTNTSIKNCQQFKPNFTQKRQWANPRSIILIIQGAADNNSSSNPNNCSWSKAKIFTVTIFVPNEIIKFHLKGFPPWHPAVLSTIYVLLCIHHIQSMLLLKGHHGDFLSSLFLFTFEKECSVII